MTRVFVYGTLKKGQPNHHRMLDPANGHARFLAAARTVDKYPLVIAGEHNIPYLMNAPGEGERVRGEIYGVDDRMLSFLDAFECVPAMYQRTVVRLQVDERAGGSSSSVSSSSPPPPPSPSEDVPAEGATVDAHVYSTTTYEAAWRALPTHESYDAYGDHGLAFVGRESRH
ncbi:unnamed protein product [Lota lota]